MSEQQDLTFEMNVDGERVACTVLFTFTSQETGGSYMLYTTGDPAGDEVPLSAARFDPENLTAIYPLKDDADRAVVQSFIDYISTHSAEEMEADAQAVDEEDDGIHTVDDLPS